jgi:hypothetical protein
MPDLGGLLSVILSVVAIASAAGLALMRANQATLRETNTDLRNQIGDIKAARAEEQAEHAKFRAEAQARIAQLESDNAAYQRVVTGEVHWVALGTRLEDAIALLTAIKEYVSRWKKDGQ